MADTTLPPQGTVQCATECTVTVVVSPARATPDDYEAALLVWGALLAAAAAIYAARRILEIFTARPEA